MCWVQFNTSLDGVITSLVHGEHCTRYQVSFTRFLSDLTSVIFVNEKENENGEKRENNEFVNEN